MSAAGRPAPSPWVRLDGELARCQQRIDEERIASGLGSTYRCCGVVWTRGLQWNRSHPCDKRARVWRDGKPWCGVHDPEAARARKERGEAKAEATHERRARQAALGYAGGALLGAARRAVEAYESGSRPVDDEMRALAECVRRLK